MPIWKMIIEIVPVAMAKWDNVISRKKKIMMTRIMTMKITMMKKMMKMTTSGVNNMKITMMRIMTTRIMMKMMKMITRKLAGEAEEIMEI
jgi:hypothetical protein